MLKKLVCIGLGVMIVITLSGCGEKAELKEYNKENNFEVVDNNIIENKEIDTADSNSKKENILDGRYSVPNSDTMWAFSKTGKAAQSGNVHINFGTYKITKENIIEIHYTTNKFWNDDNVEISDIDLYEYISVDNDNLYIMEPDGRKNKLERYGDVTEDDFSFEIENKYQGDNYENDNKKIIKVTKDDILKHYNESSYTIDYSNLCQQLKNTFYYSGGVEIQPDAIYQVDLNGDGTDEEVQIREDTLYIGNYMCKPDDEYLCSWGTCFITDLDRNDKKLEVILMAAADIGCYWIFNYDGNEVKYLGEVWDPEIDGFGNIVGYGNHVMGIKHILTGYYKLTEKGLEKRDIEYDKNAEHTAGKLIFSENIQEIKQCIDYIGEGGFRAYRENAEVLEEGTIFNLLDVCGEDGYHAIPFVKLQDGREGYVLDYYAVEDVMRYK